MKIKNVETSNNIFLAPMADVTDFAFRGIARDFGAGLTYTEMVSAKALTFGSEKTKDLLKLHKSEAPSAVQLFGHEPEVFEKVLNMPEILPFDIIDINMGCPAPKIVKNGDGSSLMKNMPLASEIVKTCRKCTQKPLTVKFRLGFDKDISLDFAKMLEDSGVDAITLHGRTREQMYSGKVDLDAIGKVKASVKIPVIGNGDIVDLESLNKMKQTGVDAVMVGRGALGKPWVFAELNGECIKLDRLEVINNHISILKDCYSEKYLASYMKKHLLWYLGGLSGANETKMKICKAETLKESLNAIREFLEKRG